MAPPPPVPRISFLLNGERVEVADPDPRASLLSFLRSPPPGGRGLKGTKGVCLQGGCGACTVLLSSPAPAVMGSSTLSGALVSTGEARVSAGAPQGVAHRAVNACLRPLVSVDGLSVTTVEGVGSTRAGLHAVQQQMHDHNASQCGFCTPGLVMGAYSYLKHTGGTAGAEEMESIADGHLCRCTGYRSILDAFQSLACSSCPSNSSVSSKDNDSLGDGFSGTPFARACAPQIEDLCVSSGRCVKASVRRGVQDAEAQDSRAPSAAAAVALGRGGPRLGGGVMRGGGVAWRTVWSLEELFGALPPTGTKGVRLVCGNTSTGVYPPKEAGLLLDISRVPELRTIKATPTGITLGAAVTLAEFEETLQQHKDKSSSYSQILHHLARVASHPVRNAGSVVGNLTMTRFNPGFVSDVSVLLSGCGASVAVANVGPTASPTNPVSCVDLLSFLRKEDLPPGLDVDDSVVVLSVHIPALSKPSQLFLSYKVAQRAVNAHAIVNAAFLFDYDAASGVFSAPPTLVFGGLGLLPSRAAKTEHFLAGKSPLDPSVLTQALALLVQELPPDTALGKTKYRARLARSFLYKGLLSSLPKGQLPLDLVSTVTPFVRPVSTGEVSFDKGDTAEYPVSKALPKLSERIQVTGEAQYLDDLDHVGQLHAVYVQATVARAAIASLDPARALQLEGVAAFISEDSLRAAGCSNALGENQELLASARVSYFGQPVGIIVAQTAELASRAAKLVAVEYEDVQKPILTLDDAIAAKSFFADKKRELKAGDVEGAMASAHLVVTGSTAAHHQYHFNMETQRAVCLPGDDGQLLVYSSTQNPSLVHAWVSSCAGVPQHKVKIVAKRVGGGYGSKLNRCTPLAAACAIAAKIVQKPVRLLLDLSTNMQIVGGRSPYRYDYTVAVAKDGLITAVKMRVLNNHGAHYDFEYPEMFAFLAPIDNTYNIQNWDVEVEVARTNLPACTWIRAPGTVESIFVTETIVEHVAAALGLPPEAVRERNLYKPGDITVWGDKLTFCTARQCVDTVKASANFEARLEAVRSFNASSRWVKRGVSLVPVKYCLMWAGQPFNALVNIYPDGTVSVAHGGSEMGQGLNIKVAQTASFALGQLTSDGCPLELLAVKDTTTDVANNNAGTGGSIGSELCCKATKGACDILMERLKPMALRLRAANGQVPPTWAQLIAAAAPTLDLQSRFRVQPGDSGHGPNQYCSFGAAVSEVEVDMLTGEFWILRSDALLDCGKSLNPAIDIGQVQGAFVFGLGYLLSEEFVYDPATGKLLTDNTWEYKPPSYADIPIDFRVSLLQNTENPYGFLRSKASGEPPLAMSMSALFAIRHAVAAGRKEVARRHKSGSVGWVPLPAPATVERVCLAADIPLQLLTIQS